MAAFISNSKLWVLHSLQRSCSTELMSGPYKSEQLEVNELQALDDAGIDWRAGGTSGLDVSRCGILIGTAMGGMATFTAAVEDLVQKASTQPKDCSIASRVLHSLLHSFKRMGLQ